MICEYMYSLDRPFPHPHCDFMSTPFFFQTTTTGELVVDMTSMHKKPYETIILGKFAFTASIDSQSSLEYTLLPDHKHLTGNCTGTANPVCTCEYFTNIRSCSMQGRYWVQEMYPLLL